MSLFEAKLESLRDRQKTEQEKGVESKSKKRVEKKRKLKVKKGK